jgi:hypothetical protein
MSVHTTTSQRFADVATAFSWGGYAAAHLMDFNEILKTCVLVASLFSTGLSLRHYIRHFND